MMYFLLPLPYFRPKLCNFLCALDKPKNEKIVPQFQTRSHLGTPLVYSNISAGFVIPNHFSSGE